MPTFSIILATRDRPALFAEALESVVAQDIDDFEIIVVNDGSSDDNLRVYQQILDDAAARIGNRLTGHSLVRRPKGHGQSYSLNFGVSHAKGEYVGFLDDDDSWTDTEHLRRAAAALQLLRADGKTADLYMANQIAYSNDKKVPGDVWLEGLEPELRRSNLAPRSDGSYEVRVADLMAASGFCHLNCLIVRRKLFEQIGGMDEGVRWECDRDLFLRLVDQSNVILHNPAIVSRHNVPDVAKSESMTTSISMIQKRLFQVYVLDKAALFSKSPLICDHARQHKGYALKKIAEELDRGNDRSAAAYYAREALGAAPTLPWFGFTVRCVAKGLLQRLRS